ncbi:helix-turn-helix transcriptional regulator [Pseudohaliea rubra]|uniref:HTH merR-type domain-containing protein n=1 Tax=Pseudohaliea rubra DSM 19751 TaxID=1265313 RepID=A0A095XXS8_9GAMM|nr:hypothetical protein [Pseudohaliea rubra]KGE04546.1 hypothetical protein HRUBRA_00885 [Pseudohaliea rubra DSM 19751]
MATKPTRPAADPLLSASQVCQELGGITRTTLWRWRREGLLPEPVTMRGRNYWRASVIEQVKGKAPEVAA